MAKHFIKMVYPKEFVPWTFFFEKNKNFFAFSATHQSISVRSYVLLIVKEIFILRLLRCSSKFFQSIVMYWISETGFLWPEINSSYVLNTCWTRLSFIFCQMFAIFPQSLHFEKSSKMVKKWRKALFNSLLKATSKTRSITIP